MDISLIEQREIEARLAVALIEGYAEKLGRKEALAISVSIWRSEPVKQCAIRPARTTGGRCLIFNQEK